MRSKRELGGVEAVGVAAARSPRRQGVRRARRRTGRARRAAARSGPAPRRSGRAARARRATSEVRHMRARANSEHDSHALAATRKLSAARCRSSRASDVHAHSASTWWARANVRPSPSPSSAQRVVAMRSATSMSPSVMRARADSMATRRRTGGGAVTARSTARSMSADRLVERGRWRGWRRRAAAAARGRARRVEPRRASRLSIGRGSTVSATDSLRPFIMLVARSWSPASRTRPIASRARPRSQHVVGERAGDGGIDRRRRAAPAALASSRAPVIWRRSGTPAATASCDEAGAAEAVEQVAMSMPGARASSATTERSRGVEVLQRGLAGDAHHVRGDGDGVGAGSRCAWSSAVAIDADAAVGRLARAGSACVDELGGELVDDLLAARSPAPRCR